MMVAMLKWHQIWQNGWAMWHILKNNENENDLAIAILFLQSLLQMKMKLWKNH